MPISWDELSPKLHSDQFTVSNLMTRLDKLKRDPGPILATTQQSITKAMLKHLEIQG